MKRIVPSVLGLGLAATGVLAVQPPASAGTCTGSINHSEFNNIYFAERLSELKNRAGVTECDRTVTATNPTTEYIITFDANITDIVACVYRVEVHVVKGVDGVNYIRPWKQLRYCNGSADRYDMTP